MDASVFFALLALVCGLLAVIAATVWWPVPGRPPDDSPERRADQSGHSSGHAVRQDV
ncbi:hypothetical protein [Nocardia sp. NPDC050793]|uniref:hypothetical protein n=1 Tax=Nocardia sp. NPDC050793 TaxID=3155159 RepID=UPI0033CBA1C5